MEAERVPVKNQEGVEVNALAPVAPVGAAAPAEVNTKNKRGPGRPKTRLDTPYLPSVGIVAQPMKEGNIVEIVYNKPMVFRKMFALLKNFGLETVKVNFTETQVEFSGLGHYLTETVQLTMYGKALIEYYVKAPITKYIYLPDIDKVTKTINKRHNMVSLVIREEEERSKMHMIFHIPEYDADLSSPIKFAPQPEKAIPDIKDDTAYPIKFEIDSAQFKSIINSFDNGLSADVMSIKKIGESPLFLLPQKDGQKLSEGISFKNNTKINLQSAITADDIFSTSVKIPYFRALSSANISQNIEIAADKFEPISFTSHIDKTVVKENAGENAVSTDMYVSRIKLFITTEQ